MGSEAAAANKNQDQDKIQACSNDKNEHQQDFEGHEITLLWFLLLLLLHVNFFPLKNQVRRYEITFKGLIAKRRAKTSADRLKMSHLRSRANRGVALRD